MRNLIALTLIVGAMNAEAKTMCGISAANKNENTYDQTLNYSELVKQKLFIVKKDRSAATELNPADHGMYEIWKQAQGQYYVGMNESDGKISLFIGEIDFLSNPKNAVKFLSMAIAKPTKDTPVIMMDTKSRLSLMCQTVD